MKRLIDRVHKKPGPLSIWVLAGACLLTGTFSPAWAQAGAGRVNIVGQILPAPGETRVDRNVFVSLQAIGGAYQATKLAMNDRFEFSGVPAGFDYVLTVESHGRHPSQTDMSSWSLSDGIHYLSVQLGAYIEERTPAMGQPVVSVKTLLVPEEAHTKMAQASRLMEKRHYEKAVADLKQALEIYPDFMQAYNNMGVAYLRLNKTEEAQAAFAKAVELEPHSLIAQKNLGLVCLTNGEYEEAVQPLNRAAELDPLDAGLHFYLGEALYLTGRIEDALEELNTAVLLDSESYMAYHRMGWIYLEQENYPEALQALRNFLRANQDLDTSDAERIIQQLEREGLARIERW